MSEIEQLQMQLFDLGVQRKRVKLTLLKLLAEQTKRCNKCREEMGVEQFYVDTRYSDNLYPYCRECKSAMVKQRQRRKAA